MSQWTRRNVIGYLGAAGLGVAGGWFFGKHSADSRPTTLHQGNKLDGTVTYLNVVLHGLMIAAISKGARSLGQRIELVLPDIYGDKPHAYRAGTIQSTAPQTGLLKCLSPGFAYQLEGVKPGQVPDFADLAKANFLYDSNTTKISDTDRMRVFMPWPKSQPKSVRLMHRKDKDTPIKVGSTSDPNGKIVDLSSVHILTYELDGNPVLLRDQNQQDLGWAATPSTVNPQYANLHIFAEPVTRVDGRHAQDAFTAMMKLISDNGSTLDSKYSFKDFGTADDMEGTPDSGSYDGIDKATDLRNLPELGLQLGGEVANCVSGIVPLP